MQNNKSLFSFLAVIVFACGMVLGMGLAAGATWAEMEAVTYSAQSSQDRLTTLECPRALAEGESGSVAATFSNPLQEGFDSNITIEVSHPLEARRESTTLSLPPGTQRRLAWPVRPDDILWGRLILVNVYDTPPAPLWESVPTRQGSCGILVIPKTGLGGAVTLQLWMAASLLGLAIGAALWWYAQRPLAGVNRAIGGAGGFLLLVVVLTMLCGFERWWGLSMLGLAVGLLTIGVILTEFFLFPARARERYAGS